MLFLLLSRPTAVEQKFFEKFDLGVREENWISMIGEFSGEFVVWEIFELAWGVPESEISHFLVFQLFSSIFRLCCALSSIMADRTPDGAVWAAFLCPREMGRLHGIIRELRMPLFNRDHMVRMSFSQSFVTVLEVVAGDDVSIGYLFNFIRLLLLVDVL